MSKRKRGQQKTRKHLVFRKDKILLTPLIVSFVMGTRCTENKSCENCIKFLECSKIVRDEIIRKKRVRDEVLNFLDKSKDLRGPDLYMIGLVSINSSLEEFYTEHEFRKVFFRDELIIRGSSLE